jgi:hypothetical protein
MIGFDAAVLDLSNMSLGEKARRSSIVSVGMALLGRLRQSAQIKERAVLEYGHALKLLVRALADETESRTDATLSAVLLLAIFEVTRIIFSTQPRPDHLIKCRLPPVGRWIQSKNGQATCEAPPCYWKCGTIITFSGLKA